MKEAQFQKLDAWFSKYFPTFSRFGARNTLSIVVLLTLALGSVVTARFVTERQFDVRSRAATIPCSPNTLPIGAINGQPLPIWCESPINTGPVTVKQGQNSWVDEFNHNLSFADIGDGYITFSVSQNGKKCQGRAWRHTHHWIVDYTPDACEGLLLRPTVPFHFSNQKLVVEADASVANPVYYVGDNGEVMFEVAVSASDTPAGTTAPQHSYDVFSQPTIGCSLSSRREISCSVANMKLLGNTITAPVGVWKDCDPVQPDSLCKARFRFEFSKTNISVLVNGEKYFNQNLRSADSLPDTLLVNPVYVYFANWGRKQADTVRFHWGRIAVNP